MLTRSLTFRVLAVLGATLASVPAATAATATQISGLSGYRVNNQQQILGSSDTSYGEGHQPPVLWQNGSGKPLPGPGASFNLDVQAPLSESGEAIGFSYDFGSLPKITELGVVRTSLGSWAAVPNVDRSTEFFFLAGGGLASAHSSTGIKTDTRSMPMPENSTVIFAADGSFVVDSYLSNTNDLWYPPTGEPISIGQASGYALGHSGHIAYAKYGTSLTIVRQTIDIANRTVATTEYPAATKDLAGIVINGKGTLVWGTRETSSGPPTFVRVKLGGQQEVLTSQIGAAVSLLYSVNDINELGDIVFAGSTGSVAGGVFKGTTVLLAEPRSAILGQISSTAVASGRSHHTRAASLANKTVTVTQGTLTLTTTTSSKGDFTINLPAGSGYVLTAPAGYCVITGNGCHTSTPLPTIGSSGKAIKLAGVTAPTLASFEHKAKAKLKANAMGRVATKVRCRAAVNCKVVVSFKKGNKSYGSASATVKKGKVKVVTVKLNSAGKTAAAKSGGTAVGANLAVTAGKSKATTALSVKLTR